jgi:hypothetical protein
MIAAGVAAIKPRASCVLRPFELPFRPMRIATDCVMDRWRTICVWLGAAATLVALLWVGSYRWQLELRLPAAHRSRAVNLCIYRGLLVLSVVDDAPASRLASLKCVNGRDSVRAICWDENYWKVSFAGISGADTIVWVRGADGRELSRRCQQISLPLWAVLTLWSLVTAHQIRFVWRTRRRLRSGQCPRCGYDLRGMRIECPACIARTVIMNSSPRLQLVH